MVDEAIKELQSADYQLLTCSVKSADLIECQKLRTITKYNLACCYQLLNESNVTVELLKESGYLLQAIKEMRRHRNFKSQLFKVNTPHTVFSS